MHAREGSPCIPQTNLPAKLVENDEMTANAKRRRSRWRNLGIAASP